MIESLRCHIDGNNILVRWNYRDVDDNVTATCRLRKRINDDCVTEIKDIPLMSYLNAGGGCTLDLPSYPVYVEVEEAASGSVQTAIVTEAQRYSLDYDVRITQLQETIQVRRGLFHTWHDETFTYPAAEMVLRFPGSDIIRNEEAGRIPGWLIQGVYRNGKNKEQLFFWPDAFKSGNNVIKPVPISENDSRNSFSFRIAQEDAKGTPYEGLFTFGDSDTSQGDRLRRVTEIDLNNIAPKDPNGFYHIVCPFCLKSYACNRPIFRARVPIGDVADTVDKKLEAFYQRMGAVAPGGTNGRVLTWNGEDGTERISAYRAYGDPVDQWTENTTGVEPDAFVVAVRNETGLESTQKLCPECHNPIPLQAGRFPSVILSLMGNTGCGKTIYIARLVQMIMSGRLLPGYRLMCIPNSNGATKEVLDVYSRLDGVGMLHNINVASAAPTQGQAFAGNTAVQSKPFTGTVSVPGNPFGGPASAPGNTFGGASAAPGNPFGGAATTPGNPFGRPAVAPGNPFGGGSAAPGNPFGGGSAAPGNPFGDSTAASAPAFSGATAAPEKPVSRGATFRPARFAGPDKPKQREDTRVMVGSTTYGYREPFVFQLSASNPAEGGIILSICDFPGEAILKDNSMVDSYLDHFMDVINHASGMIFLFDPMTILTIVNLGEEKRREFAKYLYNQTEDDRAIFNVGPVQILNHFRSTFFNHGQSMPIPVVFALSKSDAIRDHLPELANRQINLGFLDESINGVNSSRKGVDLDELESSSDSICQFMNDELLTNSASQLADDSIWMCVSATGIAPENGTLKGKYGGPVRVLDPVEWILHRRQCMARENTEE